MPQITIRNNAVKKLKRTIDCLIGQSRQTLLLRPGKEPVELRSSGEAARLIRHWPKDEEGAWLICGNPADCLQRWFIDNQPDPNCEQYCDWAIFRQDDCIRIVTRAEALHLEIRNKSALAENIAQVIDPQLDLVADVQKLADKCAGQHKITFLDYGYEGMLPLHLSLAENRLPLLVCRIESDDPDYYRQWDAERDEMTGEVWYQQWLDRTEILEDFRHRAGRYLICRTGDENVWRALWSHTSEDNAVADSIFSGDCDPDELKARILHSTVFFSADEDARNLCDWFYGQCYGGGADEHYAYFHARDPRQVQSICDLIDALPMEIDVHLTSMG